MANLYEINKEIMDLMAKREQSQYNDDWSETQEFDFAAAFDNLSMQFGDKIESILKYSKQLESETIAYDTEIKRMQALKASKETQIEKMKNYIKNMLLIQWIDKLETWIFKLSFRASYAVVINDDEKVPTDFKTIVPQPDKIVIDKAAIKKFFKTSEWIDVPWVTYEVRQNLQIK